jgi:putative DNA primase/helicase
VGLPFEEVGEAALAEALTLLPQWLGGQRRGHEWVGERKANGGPGDSWSVNLNTGVWANFSGSERGSDLTSLYAALNHISQAAAVKQLAGMVGVTEGRQAPKLPRAAPPESPCEPIPDEAPDLKAHTENGVAAAVYRYGRAFWIARYDTPKGKVFSQHTWRNGKWWAKGYTGGLKPLYRAELLPKHPEAPVLIVEGEKCVEAAGILKKYIAMTWAGGAQTVAQSDWSALAARDVIIWPDADDPGRAAAAKIAAILEPIAKRVRVIAPNGQALGWDIADAVAEGMDRNAIAKWAGDHITDKITPPALAAAAEFPPKTKAATQAPSAPVAATAESAADAEYLPANEHPHAEDYPNEQPSRSHIVVWKDCGLLADSKDVPYATLANVSMVMRFHPNLKGRIWWDSFCERVYHTTQSPVPQEWTDFDSKNLTAFIQQTLRLPKVTLKIVDDAIGHAAFQKPRNSVREWLEDLEWDRVERLSTWIGDCLDVPLTAYSMAVARNWIISMIARVYQPGCQADHMPVLEGTMGVGKSSALEILGDRWYAAVGTAFGSYEFINTIQGKWLVEIPDMAGFSRRDHSHVISTITTRTDRYRVKYGRHDQDHPRKCIFAATSETEDYLPEMRGIRRYWPLRCGKDVNLDALRQQRPQIFAEAVAAYRMGESFHKMPKEETETEQRARNSDDLWTDDVLAYCEQREIGGYPVSPKKILTDSTISLASKDLDHHAKLRVINILKAYGWVRKPGSNSREYIKPKRIDDERKDS